MDDVNAGRDAVPYARLITDYDLVLYALRRIFVRSVPQSR